MKTEEELAESKLRLAEAHLPRVSGRAALIAGFLLGIFLTIWVHSMIPQEWWSRYDRWYVENQREMKGNPPKFEPPPQSAPTAPRF